MKNQVEMELEVELDNEIAESEETKPVASNNFEYIKIIKQTASSVVLEWKYNDDYGDAEKVFKLVTLKNREEWETICWSSKSPCTIKNLEQNSCYSIKILVMVASTDRYEVVDTSDIFKVLS